MNNGYNENLKTISSEVLIYKKIQMSISIMTDDNKIRNIWIILQSTVD